MSNGTAPGLVAVRAGLGRLHREIVDLISPRQLCLGSARALQQGEQATTVSGGNGATSRHRRRGAWRYALRTPKANQTCIRTR